MTCSHPDIKQFTFSDGQAIQCCDSCTRFDEARKAVLQPPFRFSWNRVKPSLSVKDDPSHDEPESVEMMAQAEFDAAADAAAIEGSIELPQEEQVQELAA